ncbi:MAG TPA: hypothetical protein VGD64_09850 [Acidisarcina sp.]
MTQFDGTFRMVDVGPRTTGVWKLNLPRLSVWDWYAFFLAFSGWLSFNVGGTLFGSDFMLILGLPILLTTRYELLLYKPVKWVLILSTFWLFSQMVTDLIRHTDAKDCARGWLMIIFTMAQFCVIWILVHNSQRRAVLYVSGLALATVFRSVTFKSAFFLLDPWKFGYAFPAAIGVLLLVSFLMRKRYSVYFLIPIALLAMLNVYEGFRSHAFILMITAVVTHGFKSLRQNGHTLSKRRLFTLGFAVLLAGVAVNWVYGYAASHLWLGETSYQKYEAEVNGAGGVLLGGRSEILASSAAVADSPIIGHGSWSKDPKYLWIMIQRQSALGYRSRGYNAERQAESENAGIPTHSHIMSAWVDAGILGAVFWAYILYLMVRFLVTLTGDEPFLPLVMFQVSLLIWDILFSPYGAERRFSVTFFVALALAINYQREQQELRSKGSARFFTRPAFAGPS